MSYENFDSKERVAFDLALEIAKLDTGLQSAATDSPKYFLHLYRACLLVVYGGEVAHSLTEAAKRREA